MKRRALIQHNGKFQWAVVVTARSGEEWAKLDDGLALLPGAFEEEELIEDETEYTERKLQVLIGEVLK
mgnify:CR=1 FL=1